MFAWFPLRIPKTFQNSGSCEAGSAHWDSCAAKFWLFEPTMGHRHVQPARAHFRQHPWTHRRRDHFRYLPLPVPARSQRRDGTGELVISRRGWSCLLVEFRLFGRTPRDSELIACVIVPDCRDVVLLEPPATRATSSISGPGNEDLGRG